MDIERIDLDGVDLKSKEAIVLPVAETIDVSPRPDLPTEKEEDMNFVKRMFANSILPFVKKNIEGKFTVLAPPNKGKIYISGYITLFGIDIINKNFVVKY
jgi:hypothetical protein